MIRKIYYANLALFILVLGFVALLMTERHTIPPEPRLNTQVEEETTGEAEPETAGGEVYASLGSAPIFDTLYPKPTPVPTPVPTPPPDPELDKATASWALVATLPGGVAMFEDKRTKEDWMMNVGEIRPVKYRNYTMDVKLKSTNEDEFTAVISYDGRQGEQTRTLSMFD
jgi:hypothetical protein